MSFTYTDFEQLMQTLAEGWNEGNARKSADCFGEDAVYMEPPDGLYHGIVVVKIDAGLISNWHEYQYRTQLGWEEFTCHIPF